MVQMVPAPTLAAEGTPVEDSARNVVETPVAKEGEDAANAAGIQEQTQVQPEPQPIPPLVPVIWQYILLGVAFLGAVFMVIIRRVSSKRWK